MDKPTQVELAVLRRFEPIARYTAGERFFPVSVESYIQECSLWVQHPGKPPECVVPQGQLTVEKLIQPRPQSFDTLYYLKLIEPFDMIEMARFSLDQAVKALQVQDERDIFRGGRGRLARVGYGSRFLDALFSISLLMRGRVPGGTAAAAVSCYRRSLSQENRSDYYGRIVRDNGWVIIQYWFFYPFNDWRSGFHGANDHEGDWEMVAIYCTEREVNGHPLVDCLDPQWVAFASHDYSGDDLRRRWDDPNLKKEGDHPIVYVGAGSHASYFQPGEYLSEFEIPFLQPVVQFVNWMRNLWADWLRLGDPLNGDWLFNVFRVPFVDYARGDGWQIGAGGQRQWTARLIGPHTPWALHYRGLWGLYASDPIAGENAPAGPVFNRDGSVRRSWFDPLGWAGLDKVPPPQDAPDILENLQEAARKHRLNLQNQITTKSRELAGLGLQREALQNLDHLEDLYIQNERHIKTLSNELHALRRQYTEEQDRLVALNRFESRLERGVKGDPRAHIRRTVTPSPETNLRLGIVAEVFAAVSIGVLIIGIVLLVLFARHYLVFGLAALIGFLIFVEAGFRSQLSQLVTSLVNALAIITALILFWEFFWAIVVALVVLIGLYIIWENVRELIGWYNIRQ